MDILQTYKARILNKYLLNTFSSLHGNTVKTIAVDKVMVKMNYRKKKKEVYQLMELVSLFEQLTGEKPLIKINESTEKNNVVKLEDFQLSVRLQKQKALFFINALCYVGLGERKHFTLKESNNIDLEALTLNYRYKNLKIFRPLLVRKDMNLEAKVAIEIRYKPIGISKGILTKYKFYLLKKNEFKIK
uniref:Ribosomal protein L5 n=1 Tax=Dictyostelium citrinum TaxID=361072 RepID=B2VQ38_DICCI|nr:ribosomal protein L5 [Dictyostelium citrinum]ACD12714.1 ribosomal protein L5 [Dictyostelium citrinum]